MVFCFSVTRGKRHRIPLFNNIAIRITENDKYLSFFTERGMPLGRELQKELAGLDLRDHEKRGIIYDLYFNDKYLPLQEWILKNGRSTYIQFMLLNPSYPLLLNEPEQSKLNIFASNLVEYIGEPAGLGIITEKLFPVIPSWLIPVLALVLLILNIRHGNTGNVLLILFTAGLAVNALLVYNADSLEQGRHLFFNSLYIEITGVVLLVSIADRLYQLNAERRNYSGVK